jgi:CDP-diacylglycerol pyrophosphatase
MFISTTSRLRQLVLRGLFVLGGLLHAPGYALDRSDILLDIVTHCVNPVATNYCSVCRVPRNDAMCGEPLECKKNTEVWALSDRFTVIRDIKMCGCEAPFVHGLALPTTPVTGVEDPRRPEGIWKFAWDAGVRRIAPEALALVVNPRLRRSQNQLHVHIVRLAPEVGQRLDQENPSYVRNLDAIWATASRDAAAKGLEDYGVLVKQGPAGGFWVAVTAYSPEAAFTQWRCD